jgi:hypothetical protein
MAPMGALEHVIGDGGGVMRRPGDLAWQRYAHARLLMENTSTVHNRRCAHVGDSSRISQRNQYQQPNPDLGVVIGRQRPRYSEAAIEAQAATAGAGASGGVRLGAAKP